jgi:uncharacterized surface protein with fasciclin (FAS1) repeats
MKIQKYNLFWAFLIITAVISFSRCEYPYETNTITEDLLIGEYFEEHADTFSVFATILNKTDNMAFLKSYGEYTCFAPTNDAFRTYFTQQGIAQESSSNDELISTVESLNDEELTDLVRYNVIKGDTISSEMFIDGRMNTPTMYGHYLTYSTNTDDGELVETINKTAVLEEKDISLLNGVLHTLKSVIEPEKRTVAQYIEELEGYSIFAEALKETGLYEELNIPISAQEDTIWQTFFAVSDEILKADGITSVDDIGEKYAGEDIPADTALYRYMAYHILPDQYQFLTDLVSSQAVSTRAPGEVLTVKSKGNKVLINDDIFAGVHEPGFNINRDLSDQTADNGVIHFMEGNFFVKVRYPFAVYWDVTDQPEIKKMPGVFRKTSAYGLVNGQIENVSWQPQDATIDYSVGAVNGAYGHIFNDFFAIYLRPAVVQSIKLTTPTLVKGSYKIWVCMRTQIADVATKNSRFYVYFNGEQTTKIVDNRKSYSAGSGYSDGELNLVDLKIYNYDPTAYQPEDETETALQNLVQDGIANNWVTNTGRYGSQLAGTVIVEETGKQTIEFVAISGGVNAQVWLDQIQFIPVDEDQNWPRINWKDGSRVYKEDLEAGILPE